MAGTYKTTPLRRRIDAIMAALGRRGMAPGGISSLTVAGRRTGESRTVPVTPVVVDGRRYLVAPYGPVGGVQNLRAAGEATLQRGSRNERIRAEELAPDAAAPVLKHYVQQIPIVRPHVAAAPDASVAEFAAIARDHPVFAITPIS
ncbi:nitroreductase/quinone reductase family protein [Microbacterium sp. NPDC096154]|uniref:nitroreductase/quinone reductase family protein n=1 Tax=Microbacterium sp. NPDC096154 TaxID=3155549 RepID=UPI003317440F